ncbi:hypothetical protein EVG20_g345 [Dentipellis fragilis]|uniref:Uncharacterized protein n=1 Tax=Dentipellis fragilis TaxID=205917 RepID=A0A4Y9ZGT0_9AGAM|nr:hypothetical protein EVG20_g345 [Dentipellis fragilis]
MNNAPSSKGCLIPPSSGSGCVTRIGERAEYDSESEWGWFAIADIVHETAKRRRRYEEAARAKGKSVEFAQHVMVYCLS